MNKRIIETIEPYFTILDFAGGSIKTFRKKVAVRLSDLIDFFFYSDTAAGIVSEGKNPIIYQYYEHSQDGTYGHLNFGVTIVNPGRVGNEYYLTRGHYHAKEDSAEVYVGLRGEGIILMQKRDGQTVHLPIHRGTVAYVPPLWAHRTVNIGGEKLSFFYVYPSDSGHDYGTIRKEGFAKLIVEEEGHPKIIDNPYLPEKHT